MVVDIPYTAEDDFSKIYFIHVNSFPELIWPNQILHLALQQILFSEGFFFATIAISCLAAIAANFGVLDCIRSLPSNGTFLFAGRAT